MAIAAGTAFVNAVTGTSNTVASVTTSGSDRVGIVFVKEVNGAAEFITGITWGGNAMTKIGASRVANNERWSSLWYIIAPPTASSSVVASYSASTFSRVSVMSYTGVDQTTPIDNSATKFQAGPVTTYTHALTTVGDNCWVVFGVANDTGNQVAGTGTTLRGVSSDSNIMDSNSAKTPAGSVTLESVEPNAGWASVIASLLPAGGPPPASGDPSRLMLMGVGV